MILLVMIILLPLVVGTLLMTVPDKYKVFKAMLTLAVTVAVCVFSVLMFLGRAHQEMISIAGLFDGSKPPGMIPPEWIGGFLVFRVDALSELIILFTGFLSVLVVVYSQVVITREKRFFNYYAYILLTLGATNGAALADNLLLFMVFWGFLGITLYKLINSDTPKGAFAAKKTLVMIGGSDALMLIGVGIIWHNNQVLNISQLTINTDSFLAVLAFVTLMIGSFTKAGAFPFHSWIPDYTQLAPAPSSAFCPAALDKLLGIYFMARLCHHVFVLNEWLVFIMIFTGVATLIIGVMMALIQHNYKKLLGYHAVSQVGYMIVGLGMGSLLGLLGGLFHMINNVLYKSGLFLVAGTIKKQTGKDDLDDLGGLAGSMPVTFLVSVVLALSISGVPPLNGFVSKWIIYQGIIDFGKEAGMANDFWMVWLALAVVGSALTLASFIKFISGLFLQKKRSAYAHVKEANIFMLMPMILIALLCVGFGVFSTDYVIPLLFGAAGTEVSFIGRWHSVTVSLLVIISLMVGALVYFVSAGKNYRREENFIGGEKLQSSTGHAVSEFYDTIKRAPFLSFFYEKAINLRFDIYYRLAEPVELISRWLSRFHNGVLPYYALWMIAGLLIMLLVLTI